MSEVAKMYENCNIKKQYCGWLDMGDLDTQYEYIRCDSLKEWKETALMSRTSYSSEKKDWDRPSIDYPPFTAEKQLELIKLLAHKRNGFLLLAPTTDRNEFSTATDYYYGSFRTTVSRLFKGIDETIAGLLNIIWQDLTEQERTEIAEILKG